MLKPKTENKAAPPTGAEAEMAAIVSSLDDLDAAMHEVNGRIASAVAERNKVAEEIDSSYRDPSVSIVQRAALITQVTAHSDALERLQIEHRTLLQQQTPLRNEIYRRAAENARGQMAALEEEWRLVGSRMLAAAQQLDTAWGEHERLFVRHAALRRSMPQQIRKEIATLTVTAMTDMSEQVLSLSRQLSIGMKYLPSWRAGGRGIASQTPPVRTPPRDDRRPPLLERLGVSTLWGQPFGRG